MGLFNLDVLSFLYLYLLNYIGYNILPVQTRFVNVIQDTEGGRSTNSGR